MIQVRHTLSAASLPSITEFSEPISEADEIESVLHLQKLGDEAFHKKNFHQAVTFYSDALEIDEEHAQLLSRRAIANSHLRNYKQAQRDAEILVKFNPHVSKGHQLLAMCYEKLDKPKQAISSYLKAIQLDNKHQDRQTDRLAQVVSRLCKKTNLVINLDKALSSQLMVIGETLAKDGFPRSGVEVFQAVISLRPVDRGEELDAHFSMACCSLDNKEYEKALDSFRQCLTLALSYNHHGYTVRCYLRMARICFTIEEYEDGVVYARKVVSLCEDDQDERDDEKKKEKVINMWQEMKEWLVLAYRALGDMGTALEQAELYLSSIDSKSQDREIVSKAHLLIGFLREGNGQYLEALDSYQDFLKVSKQRKDRGSMARGYGCIGRIYHKLNHLPLAKSYYEQQMLMSEKLQYYTMLAPVLKNLADLHQDMGDHEATLKYLGMYLRTSRKLDEFETECRAFLGYGDFYASRTDDTLAYHYYEEAYNLAERMTLTELKMVASLNLSRILIGRSDDASLSEALSLVRAALTYFEDVATAKVNEGGMVSDENKAHIEECSALQQRALYGLKRPYQALEVSESFRKNQLQMMHAKASPSHSLPRRRISKPNTDDLRGLIRSCSHPVLYISVLKSGVIGWFLTPESGLVHHDFRQIGSGDHVDLIKSTLLDMIKGDQVEHDMECRALPLQNSEIIHKHQKYASLRGKRKELDPVDNAEPPAAECSVESRHVENPPQSSRLLYSLLLEPYETFLQSCEKCTIVADELLLQVPFDCLSSLISEEEEATCRINMIPCLQFLSLTHRKTRKNEEISSLKGMPQNARDAVSDTAPVYLDELLRVVVPPSDRPHRPIRSTVRNAPLMATNRPNPAFVAFSTSHHSRQRVEPDLVGEMERRYLAERTGAGSSTLISSSWNGTEVPSATANSVQVYSPRAPMASVSVMGNPKIPAELMWHSKLWRPPPDMLAAQSEVHKIAHQLSTQPITGSHMTKEAVLARLSTSTIIHIASYGCWDDGVFVCSPNPTTNHSEGGATPQDRYLITSNDVSQLKIIADLVVLNFGYGNKHREIAMTLPLAFLVAGAKSVLLPQWAICEAAQDKFWYHFYDSLHDGIHVTEALRKAKLSVREDKRFRHPRYWAGYCLLGNDPMVDLKQIKTAVLDKHLTQMEQTVLKNLPKDVLNEPPKSDQEHSHDALIQQLCLHLSDLLLNHRDDDVIPGLVSLMNGYRELTQSRDSKPPVQKISTSITNSTPAVKLLSLVGFHFQAGGIDPTEPPVALYPQWDPDRLMDLTIQALHGIATVSDQADCSYALSKVLLESSAVHSDVIDLLAITKHMPEIQLKLADHGVSAVWGGNVNRELLLKLGFAEVGTLLMFEGNSHNKKLLSAVLQVLCAVCGDKGRSMLERLDPQFLGVANRRVLSKSPSQSPVKSARLKHSSALRSPAVQPPPPPPKRLPSLNPVLISDSKMAFSTSWRIIPENEAEVKEKMEVSRSLTAVRTDGQVNTRVTDEWHALCSYPQALQTLNSLGQPTVKRTKVKVHPGGSPSSQRVPLGYKPPLTLEAIEQRRDYAHYVLQERHRDVARRQEKAVRDVFLPYVKSRKVP